jgi:long-subunit acyl-CoA synthetase (AMP-forming)
MLQKFGARHNMLHKVAKLWWSENSFGTYSICSQFRKWLFAAAAAAAAVQAGDMRSALGAGLLAAGIPPGSAVGLYSSNCPHWVLLDAAAHAYSMISVPLYDSLGPEAVQYIINHAEMAVIGCSTAVLPKLLACLQHCPSVRLVVVWDAAAGDTQAPQQHQEQQQQRQSHSTQSSLQHHSSNRSPSTHASCSLRRRQQIVQAQLPPGSDPLLPQLPREVSCKLATLQQLVAAGAARPQPHVPPQPGDTATICYTSGTTGMPKGRQLGCCCCCCCWW